MKFKQVLSALILTLAVGASAFVGIKSNGVAKKTSAANKTIGFLNTSNWSKVCAYAWKSSNDSNKNAAWPGVEINSNGKTEGGYSIYSYTYDNSEWDKIIFNSGSNANQTSNLDIPASDSVFDFYNNGWAKPHSWGLCGSFNSASWTDDVQTSSTSPINATSASFTVSLKSGDTFKFRADSAWTLQLNGTQISGQNSTYFSVDGQNAKVRDYKGGTYTFIINWRVENYGDKAYGITVTNYVSDGETPWKMVGNGSAWTGNFVYANGVAMTVNPDNNNEVKVLNVNLEAGDKFKFHDGTNWYGYSNIKSGSPLASAFEADGTNIVVKTNYAGTYSFFVDTSAGSSAEAIWITSDNYITLDGWARGFVEAEDLCDGTGDEWSKYASSYAALDGAVKALFASDKVTASSEDGASYIEKAAYRYEQGVIKGQTAFAETQRPRSGFASLKTTPIMNQGINDYALIIIVTSSISLIALGGFLFAKKRKEN